MRKRPPKIALVVACSQRKRTRPPIELKLSSVDAAPAHRAIEWTRRICDVEAAENRAEDLYAGDHWRAAGEAYRLALKYSGRAELWIVSAGYGLIRSGRSIKPYSATFASRSADSVWRGQLDGDRRTSLTNWWNALPHDATLADLLEDDGTVIIAAGALYLEVLSDDLTKAVRQDATGERVSVVSAGSRGREALLPVTGAFRAALGGTDAALNARLLALLAAEAPKHHFRRSAMTRTLVELAKDLPTRRTAGIHLTDAQITQELLLIRRRTPNGSRTQAIRELRRAGIACEQSRFASIWHQALGAAGSSPR